MFKLQAENIEEILAEIDESQLDGKLYTECHIIHN
jgi:hypothetical protein